MKKIKAPEIRFKVSNGEEVVFNKKRPSTPKTMDSHDAQIWILNDIRLSSQGRGLYLLDPRVAWAELSVGVVDKKELRKLRAAQPSKRHYCEVCQEDVNEGTICLSCFNKRKEDICAEGMAQGTLKTIDDFLRFTKSTNGKSVYVPIDYIYKKRAEAQKQEARK